MGQAKMNERIYKFSREERRKIRKNLEEILRGEEEVEFAYLYGSFIEDLPFHDLDVGVYLEGLKKTGAISQAIQLAQMLSSRLRIPVDVRILNFAPFTFVYHVICGDLVFERNEEVRSRVVERTVQKYLDLQPILRHSTKEAFSRPY